MTPGHPGVRVRDARGKSGPKSLCLCCFFIPDLIFRSFKTGLADRGAWREEILQTPEITPFSLCPLRRAGHISGELFGSFWGCVCRQPPPANPFSKPLIYGPAAQGDFGGREREREREREERGVFGSEPNKPSDKGAHSCTLFSIAPASWPPERVLTLSSRKKNINRTLCFPKWPVLDPLF